MEKIKLIECPRDAMQGISQFIPTKDKIRYVNALLQVGFDTLDVGSFVSPRMIPQMQDTPTVLDEIDWLSSKSKLLTIIGNKKGAERASEYEQVSYLGYPFSISETFQKRNTNATIDESISRLIDIQNICHKKNKTLVVYLSMGFGNPYGDAWSPDLVTAWSIRMKEEFSVRILSLSDTIGAADAVTIKSVFDSVLPHCEGVELGAHLHALPGQWKGKVEAALEAGCTRIDGAINGLGGCPYASDSLTGNIPSELLIEWLYSKQFDLGLNLEKLHESITISQEIFN
jgi:hydroxymethylglutaryl-CoA lyase